MPTSGIGRLIMRLFLAAHVGLYRLTRGRFGGRFPTGAPTLLLTVRGRKSGNPLTVPLVYGRDGERYVIVASAGGAPRHPAWYLNLVATPDATVEAFGRTFQVRAETTTGPDRERLWQLMVGLYKGYEDYRTKTTREIPVVVLTPD